MSRFTAPWVSGLGRAVVGLARRGEKAATSSGDVLAALPQRRDVNGHDVEPIVEVRAKAPVGDVLGQVAVGRGHHAHVDLEDVRAAHALDLALLQHAQQLGLHGRGHVADLVEEERRAVGALELARRMPRRP
jgi:hypothetical protein